MAWEELKYNKEQINNTGKILADNNSPKEEERKALEVLDNWRAAHGYSMHIFQMTLKKKSITIDPNAVVSQRLKRVPAIRYKLNRIYSGNKPSIKLHQMQDIGGCRAIVANASLARKLYENYLKGDLKHKLIRKKDYITEPKSQDGYRSFHIVYEYKSDKGKKEFNGLLTEIQIRSRLQHLWATAVETTGFFTRQAIKSNEAGPQWIEFFKLISSAFAIMENCPIVPNTPRNEKELYAAIRNKEKELKFIDKMKSWSNAIEFIDKEIKPKINKKVKFFLLELDILGKRIAIKSYTEKEEQKAINDYSALEKRHAGSTDYDIVLVGADNTADLKKAYPSYFLDTAEFLSYLSKIVSKYSEFP